ncbi:MAG: hypothetical protein QOC84_1831, partial [Bradyrhizobium sp.]|nr:hypothetical protein [Bradyrhizobium sp.]
LAWLPPNEALALASPCRDLQGQDRGAIGILSSEMPLAEYP